jgi:tetratricopeptide (TPR) repeat protein
MKIDESNKASILNSSDKMDKALECCNRALEINTTEPLAWITKITVLIKLRRHQEAIECCNIALKKVSQIDSANPERNRLLQILKETCASRQGPKEYQLKNGDNRLKEFRAERKKYNSDGKVIAT